MYLWGETNACNINAVYVAGDSVMLKPPFKVVQHTGVDAGG